MFFINHSNPNRQFGIFGDLVQGALGGFPTKPDVPPPPQLDAQAAQTQSTSGNIGALPGLEDLGGQVNQYNQAQRAKALTAGIPGYSGLTSSASGTIGNWLTGSLSPDVASSVQRASNAKAFAGGYQGSGMGDNLTARDLGLTSLDLQRMGVSGLPGYLSTMNAIGVPPQFNISSGLITPGEQLGVNQFNVTNQYENQWLRNQLASIPDPETAAIAKDVGGMTDAVASMIPYFGTLYGALGQSGSGGGSSGGMNFMQMFGGGGTPGAGGGVAGADASGVYGGFGGGVPAGMLGFG